jgi:glucan 1,3-beta-glucosidase
MNWDWLWSFKHLTFNNCPIGLDMTQNRNPSLGSALLSDSVFNNVTQAIITTFNCSTTLLPSAGTLVIDNVDFRGAQIAISYPNKTAILPGGSIVPFWMQGQAYSAYYGPQVFPNHGNETCYIPKAQQVCVQGSFAPPPKPISLLNADGAIVDRAKPNYNNYPLSAFVSTKDNGCAGDGVTDDTECIKNIFAAATPEQVVYFDHGAYVITDTIQVPTNIKIMGEAWPMIMVKSSPIWSDMNNPAPAWQVGNPGDVGNVEMQDIIFETMGPTPGAILLQWNLAEDAQASAGTYSFPWLRLEVDMVNRHVGCPLAYRRKCRHFVTVRPLFEVPGCTHNDP